MCVDDTSFRDCPAKMPQAWPNTWGDRIASLRLLRPWVRSWGDESLRKQTWEAIVDWVKANDAKVLVGTDVVCDRQSDDEMWNWTLELLKMLGPSHVMGVSIGNEMDIFGHAQGKADGSCNKALWDWQYWAILQSRVYDLDSNGFQDTKVTSVWSLSVLRANETPFREDAQAKVNTLMEKAFKKWGRRWVWSFNVYSVWDDSIWPTSREDCADKVARAISIDPIKNILRITRERVKRITGNDDDTMWVAENGWTSPAPNALTPALHFCPKFWSVDTFRKAYETFLSWNLSIGDGLKGPEHIFYYAMRDSHISGVHQSFGLINSCADDSPCKIQDYHVQEILQAG